MTPGCPPVATQNTPGWRHPSHNTNVVLLYLQIHKECHMHHRPAPTESPYSLLWVSDCLFSEMRHWRIGKLTFSPSPCASPSRGACTVHCPVSVTYQLHGVENCIGELHRLLAGYENSLSFECKLHLCAVMHSIPTPQSHDAVHVVKPSTDIDSPKQ